jgi:hypothetical protein
MLVEVEAGQTGQVNVKHQACRIRRHVGLKQCFRRGKRERPITGGIQESFNRLVHAGVVVHYDNGWPWLWHSVRFYGGGMAAAGSHCFLRLVLFRAERRGGGNCTLVQSGLPFGAKQIALECKNEAAN